MFSSINDQQKIKEILDLKWITHFFLNGISCDEEILIPESVENFLLNYLFLVEKRQSEILLNGDTVYNNLVLLDTLITIAKEYRNNTLYKTEYFENEKTADIVMISILNFLSDEFLGLGKLLLPFDLSEEIVSRLQHMNYLQTLGYIYYEE